MKVTINGEIKELESDGDTEAGYSSFSLCRRNASRSS